MQKRTIFFIAVAICFTAISGFIFVIFQEQRPRERPLRIGYNGQSVNHAPIMVALKKGFFAEAGLSVEPIVLKSGQEVRQALAFGEIDVGSAGAAEVFIPIAKGGPVKIIAPLNFSSSYLFVRPDSQIETFNDLKGKTIISRNGSSSNIALRYVLKEENINAQSINFIDVEDPYRPIALMEKKIADAAVASDYEKETYQKAGAIIHQEWDSKAYFRKIIPRTTLAVNTDYLAGNSKNIEKFIEAMINTQRFIKFHPDEAAAIIVEHIKKTTADVVALSSEEVIKSWRNGDTRYVLWCEPAIYVELAQIAKDVGDIKDGLYLEQIFDLRFASALKKAQADIYGAEN